MADEKKRGLFRDGPLANMRSTPERTLMAQQVAATRDVLAAQQETNRLLTMLTERVR